MASFIAISGVLLAIGVVPVQASAIDWTLQNVVFTDGGSAIGTFSTDATTGNVISFNITTTAGSKLGGWTYDNTVAQVYDNKWAPDSFDITNELAHVYLELAFSNPLTTLGTNLLSSNNQSYECNNCYPYRIAAGGEAVGVAPTNDVPEPASSALLLMGLIGLGTVLRHRGEARGGEASRNPMPGLATRIDI